MLLTSTGSFRELVGGSAADDKNLLPPETFFTGRKRMRVQFSPSGAAVHRAVMHSCCFVAIIRLGRHRIATFTPQDSTDPIYWQIGEERWQVFGWFDLKIV
jgi:hypothetical protein